MYIEECGDLIQIEAEELAEAVLGAGYFDLTPDLRAWVRARAIESLWPENRMRESRLRSSRSSRAFPRKYSKGEFSDDL